MIYLFICFVLLKHDQVQFKQDLNVIHLWYWNHKIIILYYTPHRSTVNNNTYWKNKKPTEKINKHNAQKQSNRAAKCKKGHGDVVVSVIWVNQEWNKLKIQDKSKFVYLDNGTLVQRGTRSVSLLMWEAKQCIYCDTVLPTPWECSLSTVSMSSIITELLTLSFCENCVQAVIVGNFSVVTSQLHSPLNCNLFSAFLLSSNVLEMKQSQSSSISATYHKLASDQLWPCKQLHYSQIMS